MEKICLKSRRVIPLRFLMGFLMAAVCSLSVQNVQGVTLAWNRNAEGDIAGYVLHYGTNSGRYLNSVYVTDATTNTVSGLARGVTYFFAVTAVNLAGLESKPSLEVSYRLDEVPPAVAITAPLANARLTNGTVMLQGWARDNSGVAQVLCQMGSGPFQPATGTTNWSALLNLVPGPNTVRVKSVDWEGNESLPISETITCVVLSPLTVGTNGNGSIVPNLNGQLLEIAKSYTLSAAPGLGFVFTNWTGAIATNAARLTFVMQSNLVLLANFIDVMKPTVSITSPLANARLTNGTVILRGRASDNKAVAQVFYQLGSGPFQPATGTTNWSASLDLIPGPNTVRVKSVDWVGHESLPLSETITCVVLSPFSAGTNGNGSIAPNLNGQLLEIAKSYTLSAVPGLGFVFTNWTGAIATNAARLTFVMQSNLVLRANFIDVMKPTVSIMSPLANARLTNGTVTLRGRASDNKAVAQVFYRLGSGPFQPATGTTNWFASLDLVPGPNTVRVKSVDWVGHESLPLSETITYVVLSPLTVSINGTGSIVPNLNGRLLEVGEPYSLTAVPGAGFVFSNWVGGFTAATAQLPFKMQSNLVLIAQFIPNPFIAVKGSYNGLFFETNGVLHESSGFFRLTLTDRGAFSGMLIVAGKTFALTGQFDVAGNAQETVARPGQSPVTLNLELDGANDQIKGTVSDGVWLAELTADRSSPPPASSPYHGYYTMTIPGDFEAPVGGAGDGYALVTVDLAGNVFCQGKLADGQAISQSAPLSKNGEWPLYVSLYGGGGSIVSWIIFTNTSSADLSGMTVTNRSLQGLLSWIRPGLPGTQHYPAGFTNEAVISGAIYTPPTTNRILNFTIGQVVFSGGNLAQPLTNGVAIDAFNRLTNLGSDPMSFTVNPGNGFFSGNFRVPGSGVLEGFEGVLLPSKEAGFGFFFGTNQSGQVRFEALP